MTQHDSVTAKDLLSLEERLNNRIDSSANETRRYMDEKTKETRQYMDEKTEETRHYFLVVAEQLTHDFRGTHKDKISQHEDRILVLEKHAGIKA